MGFKLSDNFGPLRKNWIKGAIKRPGAFKAKAEKAGESTKEYAKQVTDNPKSYDSRTVKQAHLAETLMGMNMNESPANMHTDKHMRRQAEKKAKKTQGDAQDIYYEMKSEKMEKEKKKDSPAKMKSPAKKVTKEPDYVKRAKELAKGDTKKEARLIKAAKKQIKSSPAKLKKGSPAKGYKSDAQRKAVHASKADGGKGAPSKLKKDSPAEANKFMAALQAAKDKGEKSFVVNGKNYNVTSKK